MESQKQISPISKEKEYDVFAFDVYWRKTVKVVLELCKDEDVFLGAYSDIGAEDRIFEKDIRFYVMYPAEKRSKFKSLVDEVDWQDEDCYYITPNDEHHKKTEAIKADLKRFLEISEELDKIVSKYS